MSDIASSTKSKDGTASEYSDVSVDTARISQRSIRSRLHAIGSHAALTKDNLKKNDSRLANDLRLYQAQGKVDRTAAAFTKLAGDGSKALPEKTKRQLLEDKSGVSPMNRFLKTADDSVGGEVDEDFWNHLTLHDPLAAELDTL